MPRLPSFTALRYVEPLREGGSLPAMVDTDGGLFVVKFRGAGQGPRALVAELLVGMLAQEAGLPVPELALVEVPEPFGRSEPDPEIQDLLRASHGVNVGLRYLDGAFNFAPAPAGHLVTPELAARLVWLDAFLTNPDRTARNTNLLVWEGGLWLIDHGAALYAHHDWARVDEARVRAPFPLVRDHVLLSASGDLAAADRWMADRISPEVVDAAVAALPAALLPPDADEERARYRGYLRARLAAPRAFVDEAVAAHARALAGPAPRLSARR